MEHNDLRSYGRNHRPEDLKRCCAEVSGSSFWSMAQCGRPRGKGPNGEYCTQHAAMIAKGDSWKVRAPQKGSYRASKAFEARGYYNEAMRTVARLQQELEEAKTFAATRVHEVMKWEAAS